MQLSRIRLLPRVTTANVCRMRSSACDTLTRLCVRHVLCWFAFPLVSALRSTSSAADCSALFTGFTATMAESDFPRPCIIGSGSSPSRCGPSASVGDGQTGDLPGNHFVAHSHTPRTSCVRFVFGVAAASRNTRFQAARYGLTCVGLSPTDRASFAWRLPSLDHLVGTREQRNWRVEAKRLGGVEVDHELEFGRILHR